MAKQKLNLDNPFAKTEPEETQHKTEAPPATSSPAKSEELVTVACRLAEYQYQTLAGYARDKGVPPGYLVEFFISDWLRALDNQERKLPEKIEPPPHRKRVRRHA